jgi:hypothetical protein
MPPLRGYDFFWLWDSTEMPPLRGYDFFWLCDSTEMPPLRGYDFFWLWDSTEMSPLRGYDFFWLWDSTEMPPLRGYDFFWLWGFYRDAAAARLRFLLAVGILQRCRPYEATISNAPSVRHLCRTMIKMISERRRCDICTLNRKYKWCHDALPQQK